MLSAKLANCRHVLMRAVRDHGEKDPERSKVLLQAADALQVRIGLVSRATNLDSLRGIEGDAAVSYFAAFPQLMINHDPTLIMKGRSRRPPLDPVNALLSFLYSLLTHDCRSALESCGLDSQCGFLHRDRPGRPSLALDLIEEFRAFLADRTALTLFNRRQLTERDFETANEGKRGCISQGRLAEEGAHRLAGAKADRNRPSLPRRENHRRPAAPSPSPTPRPPSPR